MKRWLNNTLFRVCTDSGWFTNTHLMGYEIPPLLRNQLAAARSIEETQEALFCILESAPAPVHSSIWLMSMIKLEYKPRPLKHHGEVTAISDNGSLNRITVYMQHGGYELRLKVKEASKGDQLDVLVEGVW